MANFYITYNRWIVVHEGCLADLPNDPGGLTYGGIASNLFPNWEGWPIIRQYIKDHNLDPKGKDNNHRISQVDPMVTTFFNNLYIVNKFNLMVNQQIADMLFDWFINSITDYAKTGHSDVTKEIQKLFHLNPDGVLGQQTLNAINTANPAVLGKQITEARIEYVKQIPHFAYVNDIIARADKFPIPSNTV